MPATGFQDEYRVLDPDIFGDELDKEAYAGVDRIAAIGLYVACDLEVVDDGPPVGTRSNAVTLA